MNKKMKLKKIGSDNKFKYELGLSVFNLFRSPLAIITLINTFLLLLKLPTYLVAIIYGVSMLFATVGIWTIGHYFDKYNMYRYFTKSYFDRSENHQQLQEVRKEMREGFEKLEKLINN